MERRKMIIVVLIVAIVLGGIATFSIWSYLQSKQQEVEKARVEMFEVVAAAENIPLGSTIEQRQLKKVLWPRANVPPGTFTDPGPLVGRTVVSNIVTGEPLMEAKLASSDSGSGVMAYIIPEGHRAMAVAVNDVAGVAGFVLPNSTVDVIVTATPPRGERISKIVLQNLRVLAVGQKMEEKEGKAIQVPTVTLFPLLRRRRKSWPWPVTSGPFSSFYAAQRIMPLHQQEGPRLPTCSAAAERSPLL